MSRARFKIEHARLDVGRPTDGTVTIDRAAGTFTVRRIHQRREFTLPLSTVAEIVVSKVIKAEVAETRRAKGGR